MKREGFLVMCVMAAGLLGAGCRAGNCDEQSCGEYKGSASKSFSSCYISGEGSSDDEFWLEDKSGNEFYRCERAADDNDSCGVELILAKESFCAQ